MDPRETVVAHVAGPLPDVRRPLLVAVDGPDGVGKTPFADELADGAAPTGLRGRGVRRQPGSQP